MDIKQWLGNKIWFLYFIIPFSIFCFIVGISPTFIGIAISLFLMLIIFEIAQSILSKIWDGFIMAGRKTLGTKDN